MRHRQWMIAAALATLSIASPASAQQSDPEQLFAEGTALMERGKYDEALPKLEHAQKADPGIGTLFNIAVCHEKLGHLGSAYRNFRDVRLLAQASGKKAREDAARAKVDEMKTRAPALMIQSAESGDITVRIDGESLKKDDWAYYPVDPGEHKVDAIAPSKKPWSTTVPTPAEGKVVKIDIPALETAKDTRVVTVTKETTNNRRTLAFVFGGLGVAGVATAAVTGIMLLGDHSTADEHCPNKVCRNPDGTTNPDGKEAVDRGKVLLPVNAVAWGVAAIGLGVGAFFFFTSGKKAEPAKTALVPHFDATSGGASLVGSF